MPRNVGVRGPRHTLLLQDRMPPRHCEFSEEAPRMMYHPTKLDIENVRASYTPSEHQVSPFSNLYVKYNMSRSENKL